MIVIGCDNGLDGGVVALRGDGTVLLKLVTPTLGVVGKGKREFEVTEVEWLEVPPLEEVST